MICNLSNKYKSVFYIYTLFIFFSLIFINFSYAKDSINTKEDLEKIQLKKEIYSKYQSIAKSLNITKFNDEGYDDSKMAVTSTFNLYKVRYLPVSSLLDITFDYDKQKKKITSIVLKSRVINNPEKIQFYKDTIHILSKIIDPKMNNNSFEKIYSNLDIKRTLTEPKYLKSYINNKFLFEVSAYSRRTQIFTLKIREKNKNDEENIELTKKLNDLYFKTLSNLNIKKSSPIYPELNLSSIKNKKALFFTSENISMELFLETSKKISALSGTIIYENPNSPTSKRDDFYESTLILLTMISNNLSSDQIKSLITNLNIDEAIKDKKYYKEFTSDNKVYTFGYIKNKLYLSVKERDETYDKKSRLESLVTQLYNTAVSDLNLINKVKLLESRNTSVSLLANQNTVIFYPTPLLTFKIYFDNNDDSVSRVHLVTPRDNLLNKNLENQKYNALIAAKIMNPDINYQEAENIYNSLKNAYGTTDTRIIDNFRYKRCTYKDETLVFSKALPESTNENSVTTPTDFNSPYTNPNLVYEPNENRVNKSGKRTLIIKPQPLCY